MTVSSRLSTLEPLLEESAARALVVVADSARDPDLAPFTGEVHLHASVLVAARGQPPLLGYLSPMEREEAEATGLPLVSPEELGVGQLARAGSSDDERLASVLERMLQRAGLDPGRLALAGRSPAGTVHAACVRLEVDGWRFVPGHALVRRLRRAKGQAELAAIRRAADAACRALRRVAELLAAATPRDGELWLGGERLTCGRLRGVIAAVLSSVRCEQPEGNIVALGAQAAVPHTAGDDAVVVAPGRSLIVDLYPRSILFADCTRTFCVGQAPAPLVAAHTAVLGTLVEARERLATGVDGWELQTAVCERLSEGGYPTPLSRPGTTRGYVHGLGHGVGYELHELPSFRQQVGREARLEEGDVFTLEPGLYDPEAGYGVRLEDLFHLGAGGAELLTELPYELDPRAW